MNHQHIKNKLVGYEFNVRGGPFIEIFNLKIIEIENHEDKILIYFIKTGQPLIKYKSYMTVATGFDGLLTPVLTPLVTADLNVSNDFSPLQFLDIRLQLKLRIIEGQPDEQIGQNRTMDDLMRCFSVGGYDVLNHK